MCSWWILRTDAAVADGGLKLLTTLSGAILLSSVLLVSSSLLADENDLHKFNIDWAAVEISSDVASARSLASRSTASPYVGSLLSRIDQSLIPVLVPNSLLKSYFAGLSDGSEASVDFTFVVTPGGYATKFKLAEFSLLCRGYAATLLVGGKKLDDLESDTKPKFSRNNLGGFIATFRRFGASYACEIACSKADLTKNEKCIDRRRLEDLINEQVAIGPLR